MKKLLVAFLITSSSISLPALAGWNPAAKSQAEYDRIKMKCLQIIESFTAMGVPSSNPAVGDQVFNYLRSIGSDASFQVLQDLVKEGRLPTEYLRRA